MKNFLNFIGFHNIAFIVVVVIFCYLQGTIVAMKSEIQMIKTVLITKGIMPECFFKEAPKTE